MRSGGPDLGEIIPQRYAIFSRLPYKLVDK